jgi:hypothetical protein
MPGYKYLREETLSLFPGLKDAARKPGHEETWDRLELAERQLRDGRLLAVVCGEFQRGKSSLINALLGEEPGILPEDSSIATSVIARVGYGAAERITVLRADADGAVTEREIPRGDLPAYMTERGNPGNAKGVQEVIIEIPNERLKPGLVLVDTPGIGGLYAGHFMATDAMLPKANAIVFVTDATQPLTDGELRFLRRAAKTAKVIDDEDALLFVLTKIDKKSDYSELLADTQARLAAAVGRPAQQVRVVPVSSRARRRYLKTGSSAQRRLSNFDELEDLIWAALTRRQAKILLNGALADLETSAVSLLKPIEDAAGALRSPSATAALRETIDARHRSLEKLAAANAPWRRELATGVARTVREVQAKTLTSADEAWRRLEAELDDLLDEPGKLNDRIDSDILMILGTADRLLHDGTARLQRELAERNGLALGRAEMARLPAPPVPDIRIRAAIPAPRQPSMKVASTVVSLSDTVGTMLARLLEALFLPAARGTAELVIGPAGGVALAALSGSVVFSRKLRATVAQRRDRKERRAETHAELERTYRELRQHFAAVIDDVSHAFASAIGAELESRIRQERDSAEESARRVRDQGPHDEAGLAALHKELAAERAPLDLLRARVAELSRLAVELATQGDHG